MSLLATTEDLDSLSDGLANCLPARPHQTSRLYRITNKQHVSAGELDDLTATTVCRRTDHGPRRMLPKSKFSILVHYKGIGGRERSGMFCQTLRFIADSRRPGSLATPFCTLDCNYFRSGTILSEARHPFRWTCDSFSHLRPLKSGW